MVSRDTQISVSELSYLCILFLDGGHQRAYKHNSSDEFFIANGRRCRSRRETGCETGEDQPAGPGSRDYRPPGDILQAVFKRAPEQAAAYTLIHLTNAADRLFAAVGKNQAAATYISLLLESDSSDV
jgi:hypothetical protein